LREENEKNERWLKEMIKDQELFIVQSKFDLKKIAQA